MIQTENAPTGLAEYVPLAGWLRYDVAAGLTAAAVDHAGQMLGE